MRGRQAAMVQIKPFRGYHYNFKALGIPPEKLLAPPYDVISDDLLRLLSSEPLNIANVMLGNRGDAYRHASELLAGWTSSGKLVQDDRQGYYVYEQTFAIEGRTCQRTGLVALLSIEPLGKNILPHEKTHPKVKRDRLELLGAINANIEQIFLIYDDRSSIIDPILSRVKQPGNELLTMVDLDNVRHRLFRLARDDDIKAVTEALSDKKVLIADGHHRYETALEYSRQMDKKRGAGTHDFVLVTLVNARDPGLIMLPTHRLVHAIEESRLENLQTRLSGKFDIQHVKDKATLMDRLEGAEGRGTIAFWFPAKKFGFIAALKPEFCSKDPVERLDVSILHRYVLEGALGITTEMQETKEKVEFVKGTVESFREAEEGNYQLMCLLSPASIPEIMEAAETGRLLPHKSTYFYPKLWSGLVIYIH